MARKFGFFVDDPPKRYNTKSLIAATRRRDERDYGPFKKKTEPWTVADCCNLLDWFLYMELPLVGTISLVANTKRSRDGVETKIRKLAIRFDGIEPNQLLAHRLQRRGCIITERDRYIIGLATGAGAGKKYGAVRDGLEYLAAVLGRDVKDTRRVLEEIVTEKDRNLPRGFFDDEAKVREMKLGDLTKAVGDHLDTEAVNFQKKFFIKEDGK